MKRFKDIISGIFKTRRYCVECKLDGKSVVYCDAVTLAEKWLELGGDPEISARAFYHYASGKLYVRWSDDFGAGHELKHAAGFHHNKVGAWINSPDGRD